MKADPEVSVVRRRQSFDEMIAGEQAADHWQSL